VIDVRRVAGGQWAFRAVVEHDAARRFARLATAIEALDPGSPVPALLRIATADERRHALLCERLAMSYGASPLPLPAEVRITPPGLSPRDSALYEMVAASCLTETESVATLTTLLGEEAEPAVREVLHEIARDEVNHSRMGWAHLAREAERGDVAFLSPFIVAMLRGMADPALFSRGDPEPDGLLRHGVLPRAKKRETFVSTLREVVFPGLARFGIDVALARAWLDALALTTEGRI
jgi:hypothetical protein